NKFAMFRRVLLTLSIIFNAYNICASYKYSVAIQDEKIFVPCNISGVYFGDRYVDMSSIRFEFLSNGSVHAHGSVTIIKDLGTDHVGEDKASLQIFKKDRDRWAPTVYNMNRPDLCETLFNPTEIWHKYTQNISKDNRKCPFFVGQTLNFDEIADLDIILPDPNIAGNYMAIVMTHFKGASYKYSVAIQDEKIFVPCNISGVYFVDRYLDRSNVRFEFLSNGSIHAHGSAIFIGDLGTDHVGEDKSSVQIFKKDRDRWAPTIYNINRPDLCQTLFNPTEIWNQYTKNISKDNRKCPFFVGQILTFDEIADLDIILPDPNIAGNYMIIIMTHFKGVDEHMCAKIYVNLIKLMEAGLYVTTAFEAFREFLHFCLSLLTSLSHFVLMCLITFGTVTSLLLRSSL
ncbi:hypothetical protein DOY81_004550, partial [Sarcophaga bullata]